MQIDMYHNTSSLNDGVPIRNVGPRSQMLAERRMSKRTRIDLSETTIHYEYRNVEFGCRSTLICISYLGYYATTPQHLLTPHNLRCRFPHPKTPDLQELALKCVTSINVSSVFTFQLCICGQTGRRVLTSQSPHLTS